MAVWEKNIRNTGIINFKTPELTRLRAIKDEESQGTTWTSKAMYRWAGEKIKNEKRCMAREAGLLFDDPSGLDCGDERHVTEIIATGNEYPDIKVRYKEHTIYFCLPCTIEGETRRIAFDKELMFEKKVPSSLCMKNIKDAEERIARLSKGDYTIRTLLDKVYIEEVGYHCPSCGVVSGTPNHSWESGLSYRSGENDRHLSIKCSICDEEIGYDER